MAWQNYVDENLMHGIGGGQQLTAAAIFGHDGSAFGQSSTFPQLKPEQVASIVDGFAEPGSIQSTGLNLGGDHYFVIQVDGSVMDGKKGSGGVSIKKTNQTLIFGIYEEPVQHAECSVAVQKLGDYLLAVGY